MSEGVVVSVIGTRETEIKIEIDLVELGMILATENTKNILDTIKGITRITIEMMNENTKLPSHQKF